MKPIDEHVRARVSKIFAEKERYAYVLKQKAEQRNHACMCVSPVHISNPSIQSRHWVFHSRSGMWRGVVLSGRCIAISHCHVLSDLPFIRASDTLCIVHPYVSRP